MIAILLLLLQKETYGSYLPLRINTYDIKEMVVETAGHLDHAVEGLGMVGLEATEILADSAVDMAREVRGGLKDVGAEINKGVETLAAAERHFAGTLDDVANKLTASMDNNTMRITETVDKAGDKMVQMHATFHKEIPGHVTTVKEAAVDGCKQLVSPVYDALLNFLATTAFSSGIVIGTCLYNGASTPCTIAFTICGGICGGAGLTKISDPVHKMIKNMKDNRSEEHTQALKIGQRMLGKEPEKVLNGISQMDQFVGSWEVVKCEQQKEKSACGLCKKRNNTTRNFDTKKEKYTVERFHEINVVKNEEGEEIWTMTIERDSDENVTFFVLSKIEKEDEWVIKNEGKSMVWNQRVGGNLVPSFMLWVKIPQTLADDS